MVALGGGNSQLAEAKLAHVAQHGGWLFLQNLHLVPRWLPRLSSLLEVALSAPADAATDSPSSSFSSSSSRSAAAAAHSNGGGSVAFAEGESLKVGEERSAPLRVFMSAEPGAQGGGLPEDLLNLSCTAVLEASLTARDNLRGALASFSSDDLQACSRCCCLRLPPLVLLQLLPCSALNLPVYIPPCSCSLSLVG